MNAISFFLRCAMAISAVLLAIGCAVGPDFRKPSAPDAKGYTRGPLRTTAATPTATGGEAQVFEEGLDIPGAWWTLFHNKALNDLVERSLKANPTITSARAALQVARDNVRAQVGAYFPQITAGYSGARYNESYLSPNLSNNLTLYSLFTPMVSVSFVPDVWGLNRRTVESLNTQKEQARYQLAAAMIALSANVVITAIGEASVRAQIDATRELVAINSNMLEILKINYAKGQATRLDVATQASQLAQVLATLPPLLKQLAQVRDLLDALEGRLPDRKIRERFHFSDLDLPRALPVSLPARLVRQRPDVLQAEENLHFASAQIGISIANRLPNFNLFADIGTMAGDLGQPFAYGSGLGFWDFGVNITQPLFMGGTLLYRQKAAEDAYVQAAEQYRSTVITAFQNIADTLYALKHDADALKAATAAVDSARVTFRLGMLQLKTGYGAQYDLLVAEQTYQQALISRIQAQANRYADTAALFLALGGGWWNRKDLLKG